MTDVLVILIALLSGALGFMVGRTMPTDEKVKEIRQDEISEETQRKIRRLEREYQNFLSYDGTKQTDDIGDQ